jgi:hypothetical protein
MEHPANCGEDAIHAFDQHQQPTHDSKIALGRRESLRPRGNRFNKFVIVLQCGISQYSPFWIFVLKWL